MNVRVPLAKPEITDADREAVAAVLRTPHLSMGPRLTEFEQAMAAYLHCPFAVAVNSGTSALHLAIKTLNIPQGAEVILPSFTFSAVLNVLLQEGLLPIFAEIDASTFNLTVETVAPLLSKRTAAVIVVHTFGRPAPIGPLRALCREHAIPLIEDACEALGAEVNGQKVGTFGDAGVLAFYPNKQITTGEGGMLLTPRSELAGAARRLRNQGRDPSLDWFQHVDVGYSYRLSDMNCALGTSQLHRIEETMKRRQFLAELYDRRIAQIGSIVRPPLHEKNGKISWFSYVIQLPAEFAAAGRDHVSRRLADKGIQTGRYFAPLHRQPVARSLPAPNLPVTDSVAARALALPFFNQLTEAEVDEVCIALAESLAELRARST